MLVLTWTLNSVVEFLKPLHYDALQFSRIWVELRAVAVRPPGTLGALVSALEPPVSTTSWGAWAPDSRLPRLVAPELAMVVCSLRHDGEELLGQRGGLEAYALRHQGGGGGLPAILPGRGG